VKRREFLQVLAAGSFLASGCGSDSFEMGGLQGSSNPVSSNLQPLVVSPAQAVALGGLRLAAESTAESQPVALLGGAVKVDVDALTKLTETPGALVDLSSLGAFFATLGVTRGQPVVVYDDGEMKFAARVRFLLGYSGVPQAVLVDGGAPGLAGLLPVQGGNQTASNFLAVETPQPISLVFQQQVFQAIQKPGTTKIIDVRSPQEFSGQVLLPGDARPGHIPSAINLPEGNFLSGSQLAGAQEISRLFAQSGLSRTDDIIVYCHDGAKSSLVATLLVQSGFARTSLYYLSYRDWSENPNLPVAL